MRIGVYGGSFDPPHLGHLEVARSAIEALELDEVVFVPANVNPLRQNRKATNAAKRFKMVQLMIADEPQMTVSDIEITREPPSYAIDTLDEMTVARPSDYWFICGSDAASRMREWKSIDRFHKLCRLGVVIRGRFDQGSVLRNVPEGLAEVIDFIPMKPCSISSSSIRSELEAGMNAANQLHPDVYAYIMKNRIYEPTA